MVKFKMAVYCITYVGKLVRGRPTSEEEFKYVYDCAPGQTVSCLNLCACNIGKLVCSYGFCDFAYILFSNYIIIIANFE